MKKTLYVAAALTWVSTAGCGTPTDSVATPEAPGSSVIQPAPTVDPVEATVGLPESTLPSTTSAQTLPTEVVEAPSYLTEEHLAQLRLLQKQRPAFVANVRLPAGTPFGHDEFLLAVFAASTETGDFVTLSWSSDPKSQIEGWEAFPSVNLTFSATAATERLREFNKTLPESGYMIGGAMARLGPDIRNCGGEPLEADHKDEAGVSHAFYLDETALVWEIDEVIYTMQTSPVVGCQPAPFTAEDLAAFAGQAVLCDFAREENTDCRRAAP